MKFLKVLLIVFVNSCYTLFAQDVSLVFNYYVCESSNCITLHPNLQDFDLTQIECFQWNSDDELEFPQDQSQQVCPTEDTEYFLKATDVDGNIVGDLRYRVHVIDADPPALIDNGQQNNKSDAYSCVIADELNEFLNNSDKYSITYQNGSIGLSQIGEESRFEVNLFSEFVDEVLTVFNNPDDEDVIQSFVSYLHDNGISLLSYDHEYVLETPDINDPGDPEVRKFRSFCPPKDDLPVAGWDNFTRGLYLSKTSGRRRVLRDTYTSESQRAKLDKFWPCAVLGKVHEEVVLSSLGLPLDNSLPNGFNRIPDGYLSNALYDLDNFTIHRQPFIVEVKGRFATDIFYYGSPSAPGSQPQFLDYLQYIVNNSALHSRSLSHGLYLILPAGISIDLEIRSRCSQRNIPLYISDISINQGAEVDLARVNYARLTNMNDLNYSGLAAWFIPKSVVKRQLEKMVNCQFEFQPVVLSFQDAIDDFESSYLIPPNVPTNATENCNDTLDCDDGISCEN